MADSAFKDGGSVAVPATIASIDSIVTTLPAADNIVVAIIQLDNTGAAKTITAGNLELRRGTGAGDTLIAEIAQLMIIPISTAGLAISTG